MTNRRQAARRPLRPFAERMEPRSLLNGAWGGYAKDAQHTALSDVASQPLQQIRWQAPVDLDPQYSGGEYLLIHYGSPSITTSGTLLLPVKTGASEGFEVQGRKESDGTLLWTIPTDYVLPQHGWTPSYSPALTSAGALAMPGLGGRVYMVDSPDSAEASVTRTLTFFGDENYDANPAAYNTSVFINTPITADAAGNLYFGFAIQGANPLNLQGGIARIAADGTSTFVSAATASGDAGLTHVVQNCAPALSNDGSTLYIAVSSGDRGRGDLLALNSTTLAQQGKVALIDPKSGANAALVNDGTASPVVGPDGDVYYGVLESSFGSNHARGYLLHFNAALTQTKIPGAFGWDDSPSIVPASLVPSYEGTSSYLLLAKYNNYAGIGGDGVNRVAILDPNDTAVDPISGLTAMRPVLSIAGPTSDDDHEDQAFAVREWCINTAAIDPFTKSALVNNEDGKLYRWDLTTNTFTEVVVLTPGLGEAYTPTLIGPDGAVFAINNAILFAVGAATPIATPDTYSTPRDTPLTIAAPGVLANDASAVPLTPLLVDGPAHGTIDLKADGSFTYTPAADYTGADSFTYRVTDGGLTSDPVAVSLTITAVNHAPVATDDAYSVNEGATLTITAPGVLANDTDADLGATLSALLVTAPAHGKLTLLANGSFTYTPTAGYSGADSFLYRATDTRSTSPLATVSLTVNPVVHAPTTVADSYSVAEDGKLSIAAPGVLANDILGGENVTLVAELVDGPAHGKVSLNADGSFGYTPTPLYDGPDSFTYRAKNSGLAGNTVTVSLTVTPINHPPIAAADQYATSEDRQLIVFAETGVLANDSDPEGGLRAVIDSTATHGLLALHDDGSFLYTPAPNFHGTDTFTYHVTDGQFDSAPAVVTITVTSVNDVPVASGTTLAMTQGRLLNTAFIVATFNDNDNQPTAQYAATIDWGDGSAATLGTIEGASSPYAVLGSHIYDKAGGFVAKVTINDAAGGSVVVFTPVTVAPIGVATTASIVDAGNHTASGALITNVPTPTVAGTAPAGFHIQLFADAKLIGEGTAAADNTFRVTASTPLADGAHNLSLTATTTTPGSSLSFTATAGSVLVDTTAPRIASTVFNLKKGTATITFQDDGSGLNTSTKFAPNSFVVTQIVKGKRAIIPVTGVTPTGFGSSTGPNAITITLKKKSLPKGSYSVKVAAGLVRDLAGNPLPSIEAAVKGNAHPRGHIAAFAGRRH